MAMDIKDPQETAQDAGGGFTMEQLDTIKATSLGHVNRMRYFRRQYDSRRAFFYRQYISNRDHKTFPDKVTPRSNTFVPYPYSNVETIVGKVTDAFFSFAPWFEILPRGAADAEPATNMQKVLEYLFHKSGFMQAFEDFVRNTCIYGHAGIKVDWDIATDTIMMDVPDFQMDETGQQPMVDPNTGQPVQIGSHKEPKDIPRARPRFSAIDVYDLLVDPDGGMTAHLTEKTWAQLKSEFKANPELYFPEAIKMLANKLQTHKEQDQIVIRMAEFWNELENTMTLMVYGEDSEAISWKDTRASYRASSYSAFKRKVYVGESVVLYHGDNQFMHKKSPILHTSYSKLPNEVYGLGVIEIISDLSEALNRFTNMIADNWNLGINQRYAYDVNADMDQEALNKSNVPGGKVGVSGDPSKAIFPLPFFTPPKGDYAILDLYKNMIEMTSGISDFYSKGVGSPTGNKTATGIVNVIQESNVKFRMFIRNLEVDILQPLLGMCATMVQQYVTDDLEIAITDAQPTIPKFPVISPQALMGQFDFHLVAANYATNKTVRQRNLLAFYNVAMKSPFWNQHQGLLEMGKVFEIRNMHRLLKTPEQVAAEQQAQLQQQIHMMILEKQLDTQSQSQVAGARAKGQGQGGGRPRTSQFEGKIPGQGITSSVREIAQSMGANALGTGGTEDG